MISANDVMRKIQRNDDWVTVYGMEDYYDLGASAYYAESDDEIGSGPSAGRSLGA